MLQNKITTFLGRKGNGKTTEIKKRIEQKKRLIVLDHLGEYTDGLIFFNLENVYEYFEAGQKEFKVICRFTDAEDASALLDFVWELQEGEPEEITLVLEEVDKILCSPNYVDENLYTLINYGRHRKINVICAARRAGDINRILRAASDEIVTFNQTEPRDLDYLEERGFNRAEVSSLEQFKYISIHQ